jgi:hypothetical protein
MKRFNYIREVSDRSEMQETRMRARVCVPQCGWVPLRGFVLFLVLCFDLVNAIFEHRTEDLNRMTGI